MKRNYIEFFNKPSNWGNSKMNKAFRPAIFLSLCTYFILLFITVAQGATIIQGTVTEKRAGSVKVEFEPHKIAGPKIGDQVDFMTTIEGIQVNAGQGEVIESHATFLWSKVNKGRPNVKMTATIQATGKPIPQELVTEVPIAEVVREKEAPNKRPAIQTAVKPLDFGDKPLLVLITSKGTITIELDKKKAPKTVNNIIEYTLNGFYDKSIFHRVIKGFMIQGGGFTTDMNKKDTRPPVINEADNGLKNLRGTIAMVRTRDPHSATTQFFINTKINKNLDHTGKNNKGWGHCVFGKVVRGMEVVDAIESVSTTTVSQYRDVPKKPVIIQKAFLQ